MSFPFLNDKAVIVFSVGVLSQEKVSRAVMSDSDPMVIVHIHEIVAAGAYEVLDRSNFVRGIEVVLKCISKLFHGQGPYSCCDPCQNKPREVLLPLRYRLQNSIIQLIHPWLDLVERTNLGL